MTEKFNPDDWVFEIPYPGYETYRHKTTGDIITVAEYNHRCMPALEDIVLPEEQKFDASKWEKQCIWNGKIIYYNPDTNQLITEAEYERKSSGLSKRYCWLKMPEGEFSTSFNEQELQNRIANGNVTARTEDGWKLIEYTCINDETFEFTDKMKLR